MIIAVLIKINTHINIIVLVILTNVHALNIIQRHLYVIDGKEGFAALVKTWGEVFSIFSFLRFSSNQTDRQKIVPPNNKTHHILANIIFLTDLWHTSAKKCTVPQKLMDRHNCRQVWSVW